jgi:hypothetical protein
VSADDVLPRIQAAIAAGAFQARPRLYLEAQGTRFYRRMALAAAVLCAVTAGLFAWNRLGDATGPTGTTPAVPPAYVNTPSASERGLLRYSSEPVDGLEWIRELERAGLEDDAPALVAHDTIVPITDGSDGRR